MDAVQDLPAQDSADMRKEIDSTRSAMADKLEALEDRMIDTVQSAQTTVENSIQSAKDTVASIRLVRYSRIQVGNARRTMVGSCLSYRASSGLPASQGRAAAAGRAAESARCP